MAGPRESIFVAVVDQLEKIRVENGYQNDIGEVYRVDLLFDQIPDGAFPAIEVLESLAAERMEPLDQPGYINRLQMTIAGLRKDGTVDLRDSGRHTAINSLLEDTWRALMEDQRFGGTCKDSVISNPIVYVDPDRAESMFNLTLTCTYVFGRADL